MDVATFVTVLKDLATGAAAATGAVVAVKGLKTWKRQLKGTTEYDLARKILTLTYQARDKLQRIRAPMKFAGEYQQAMEEQGIELEEGEQPSRRQQAEAWYQHHWSDLTDTLSELKVAQLEAEALWGEDIPEVFHPLNRATNELRFAISETLRFMEGGPQVDPDPEHRQEMREILYRRSFDPDEDDFTQTIEDAVSEITSEIRPHLTK